MTKLIYIIDDEQDIGEMFSEFITDDKTIVKAFTNPIEALVQAQVDQPDLYFLDYRMPKMDGDELAKKLPTKGDKFLVTGEIAPNPSFSFKGVIAKPYKLKDMKSLINSYKK